MKRKIGIFSGTFDPVHTGHVSLCSTVLTKFTLDELIVIVNRDPKAKVPSASLMHRYAMTKLAFEDIYNVSVKISTGADASFEDIRDMASDTLYLLVGSDIVKSIDKWVDITKWAPKLHIVIGFRDDTEVAAMIKHTNDLGFAESHSVMTEFAGMTSTSIRSNKATQHASIKDYVHNHRLYT